MDQNVPTKATHPMRQVAGGSRMGTCAWCDGECTDDAVVAVNSFACCDACAREWTKHVKAHRFLSEYAAASGEERERAYKTDTLLRAFGGRA